MGKIRRLNLSESERVQAFAMGCELYQIFKKKSTTYPKSFIITTEHGEFNITVNKI